MEGQPRVAITLRFEESLLREAQRIAKAQHRSFNGYVASVLEASIKDYQRRQARRRPAGPQRPQAGEQGEQGAESGDGR